MTTSTNKWHVLLISIMSSFLTPFAGSSVVIALPVIGKEFGMNALLLSWVPTSFVLASAVFLVPFGRLADIYGRRRIFGYGIIAYTVSSVVAMLAPNEAVLIGSRVIQGFGGAMVFGTSVAMLTSAFPASERGKVLGINVAAVYLGLSLGPFLGGILTAHLGWRSIFGVMVPICVLILIVVYTRVKGDWSGSAGEPFDLAGSGMYSLSVVALTYGFSHLPDVHGVLLVFTGCAGIAFFVRWELRAAYPVLDMRRLKNNTVFAFSNIAALINYSATAAVGFLLSLYLQYIKGYDPQHAGAILVSMPLVMMVFSPIAGRMSDSREPRILSSIGMGINAVGLFMLVLLDGDTSLVFIIATLMVIGLGFTLFSSPNTNAVMSSIEHRSYGIASAILGTMRLAGNMLSMGIVMMVFAMFIGRVQITPASHDAFIRSIRLLFGLFGLFCTVGVYFSFARGNLNRPEV